MSKKVFKLFRMAECPHQTMGRIVMDGVAVNCLELPWKDNKRNESRIPQGEYPVEIYISQKFGEAFWVHDVPGRKHIAVHIGNYVGSLNPKSGTPDSLGCPLPGMAFKDIDGDGIMDVTDSRRAMNILLDRIKTAGYTHIDVSDRLLRSYTSFEYKEYAKVEGLLL